MGVNECDRRGCENIMCDRLIVNNNYYICDDCWKELVALKNTWPRIMPKNEVLKKIEEFMSSTCSTIPTNTRDAFYEITGEKENDSI